MVLGGKPGSGVRTIATKLREHMKDKGVAVEQIDDCAFHMYRKPCECCEATARYRVTEVTRCGRSPDPLDGWALFEEIRSATKNVTERSMFAKNGGRGLVIAQGRHVCSNKVLLEATKSEIWLELELFTRQVRYLNCRGRWGFAAGYEQCGSRSPKCLHGNQKRRERLPPTSGV